MAVGLGFMSSFTTADPHCLDSWLWTRKFLLMGRCSADSCDVSVAVSTPKVWLVPVITQYRGLDVVPIKLKLRSLELAARGRDEVNFLLKRWRAGHYQLMVPFSTPIINSRNGHLGIHNIVRARWWRRTNRGATYYVSFGFDHRIVDGRESVSFLVRVKNYWKIPGRLVLGDCYPTGLDAAFWVLLGF